MFISTEITVGLFVIGLRVGDLVGSLEGNGVGDLVGSLEGRLAGDTDASDDSTVSA